MKVVLAVWLTFWVVAISKDQSWLAGLAMLVLLGVTAIAAYFAGEDDGSWGE